MQWAGPPYWCRGGCWCDHIWEHPMNHVGPKNLSRTVLLSVILGSRRLNLITGLGGWWSPDESLKSQETVSDRCRPLSDLGSDVSDVWFGEKGEIMGFSGPQLTWTLVQHLLGAAAPGLKPLRLPRARCEADPLGKIIYNFCGPQAGM